MGCTLKELSYDDGCCYVCQYESARKKVHNFVQGNITNHFRLLSSLMVCYRFELVLPLLRLAQTGRDYAAGKGSEGCISGLNPSKIYAKHPPHGNVLLPPQE